MLFLPGPICCCRSCSKLLGSMPPRLLGGGVLAGRRGETPTLFSEGLWKFWACFKTVKLIPYTSCLKQCVCRKFIVTQWLIYKARLKCLWRLHIYEKLLCVFSPGDFGVVLVQKQKWFTGSPPKGKESRSSPFQSDWGLCDRYIAVLSNCSGFDFWFWK